MKKLLPLLACTLWFGAAQAQDQHLHQLIENETRAAAKKMQAVNSTAGTNYDLKYHRLRWQIDPAVRYITGEATSYFVATQPGVSTISFDFSSQLTLDSVRYHGQPVATQRIGHELHITLPNALNIGQADSVSVWYQGNPPQTGFGSFIKTTHAGGPVIWTLSDPWGGKDWWPCKMSLDDKIDSLDIYITTPQQYKAGSNGKLISAQQSGNNKIYHWKHNYPITSYLIALAVTNYAEFTLVAPLSQGPLEIVNYVYPQMLSTAQVQVPGIIPIIQLYDTLFAPYPFMGEKYGHAQFGWGGGMEHQTMSFMTDFSRDLMAHELAHQWFGNKITCGSWHDMWLNEGWATYVTGMVYERHNTPAQWLNWKTGQINSITSSPGGSVYVNDTTNINRIFDGRLTYNKGSMLLHMLRWVVGDSAFFAGTRNYLQDPQLAYSYALTHHFQQHMEQASGKSLTGFFADWYYGQGYPRYQVQWQQAPGSSEVTVTLGQTQSHSSVSFFEMPVPVRFSSATQDTIVVFDHAFSGQVFTFTPGFMVTEATLDPEKWLVQRNSTVVNARPGQLPEAALSLFPNPAQHLLTVAFTRPEATPVSVAVLDALGKEVLRQTAVPNGATNSFELNVARLPAGFYQLRLQTNNWVTTRKLIKN